MKIPAHAKYQIIYDTMQKNDNLLNVAAMCEIAGVSRSGYYHYLSTEDQRMEGGTGQTGFSFDSESIPVPRIS